MAPSAQTRTESGASKRRKAAKVGSWALPLGALVLLAMLYLNWAPLRDFLHTSWRFLSDEEGLVGDATERKLERWVERYGFWTVVAVRLSPILSSDGVSYVGGVLRMGFLRFMAATALGVAPLARLVSWLGESVDRLESGLLWVSAASVLALAGRDRLRSHEGRPLTAPVVQPQMSKKSTCPSVRVRAGPPVR